MSKKKAAAPRKVGVIIANTGTPGRRQRARP